MMKKLIRFVFVLALGAALGYVFHNPIDTKLKAKFGANKVESVRAETEEVIVDGTKKAAVVGKAMVEAGKEAIDSTTSE
jgi:outer membrane lipoprotein-sorting protein